eukprot:TRINITY_DN83923_c0_g1_i1.p1 TRINITY_DN83923_c0_g1~~TRINITY_DN83923_c0_g1_i1.p1  ORF type:complete len:261 (+),score=48.25 TRINITY_DN83923_c0_g1_i1:46-828(+)
MSGTAPPESLISWNLPVAPHDPKKTSKLQQKTVAQASQEISNLSASSAGKTGDLPPLERATHPQAQEIINRFIPPREWQEEDGTLWVQTASNRPATRLEVVQLAEKLQRLLIEQGAKPTGQCPIRRRLYDECFDELTRQVTAECPERGLLLLRMRDERRQTLQAYASLFESRVGYAFRFTLKGEQEIFANQRKIEQVKAYKQQLQKQVDDCQRKIELTVKQSEDKFKEDEKRYVEELNVLKKENLAKKTQLENCTTLQKR